MNEPNNSNQIPDDNFFESASQKIVSSLLPYVLAMGAKEDKEELKDLPSDILASLAERYTPEDFERWLSENEGIDFLQPLKEQKKLPKHRT